LKKEQSLAKKAKFKKSHRLVAYRANEICEGCNFSCIIMINCFNYSRTAIPNGQTALFL
jgi:hypothetical protein